MPSLAVGIGAGADELAFTTENTTDVVQQVFPTFPVVLGWGKARREAVGEFDLRYSFGQQAVTPSSVADVGLGDDAGEIVAMYDKGKAAVVVSETTLTDVDGVLCTWRRRHSSAVPAVGVVIVGLGPVTNPLSETPTIRWSTA